ncbi:MAG: hypothetical protein U9Q30_10750 [Campylobacterota bacterium]|nr:hypothetical protein [Campylobacterota bacterium]
MLLFEKLDELEKRLEKLESSIPEWTPLSKFFASQYGYTLDGFRNYCLLNIDPKHFKKFGNQYHIHKIAFVQLKIK